MRLTCGVFNKVIDVIKVSLTLTGFRFDRGSVSATIRTVMKMARHQEINKISCPILGGIIGMKKAIIKDRT